VHRSDLSSFREEYFVVVVPLLKPSERGFLQEQRGEALLRFNPDADSPIEFILGVAEYEMVKLVVDVDCDRAVGKHAGRFLVNVAVLDVFEKTAVLVPGAQSFVRRDGGGVGLSTSVPMITLRIGELPT
jgi:hypothetical protein